LHFQRIRNPTQSFFQYFLLTFAYVVLSTARSLRSRVILHLAFLLTLTFAYVCSRSPTFAYVVLRAAQSKKKLNGCGCVCCSKSRKSSGKRSAETRKQSKAQLINCNLPENAKRWVRARSLSYKLNYE